MVSRKKAKRRQKGARPGPTESESQAIGRLGARAFEAHYPETWIPAEGKAGSDFGYDYNVQFKKRNSVRWTFRIQLKATASDATFGESDSAFSIRLHRDTCNLYAGSAEPVMLVACDLRLANKQPAKAELYYEWIHDEITARLNGRKLFDDTDPEYLTFKVQKTQALTTALDITTYLEQHASKNRDLAAIRVSADASVLRTLSRIGAPSFQTIGQLGPKRLEAVLEGVDQEPEWEPADPASPKARIQELRHAVTAGNETLAERLIEELHVMRRKLSKTERAEALYQAGRHWLSKRDAQRARQTMDQAMELAPANEKYAAAGLEMHVIEAEISGDDRGLRALLKKVPAKSKHLPLVSLRSRIHARLGDRKAFLTALKPLKGIEALKSRMLGELSLGNYDEVVRISDGFAKLSALPRDEHFIRVLRVRALLHQLIPSPRGRTQTKVIPPAGDLSLDLQRARPVLEESVAALELSQRLNWPANSELLLDAAGVLCTVFNEQSRIIGLFEDFSRKRPAVQDAHVQLERLAVLAGNKELALTASERAAADTSDALAKRVLVHVEAGHHAAAVELAEKRLLTMSDTAEHLRYIALAAASFSALRLGRLAKRSALLSAVPDTPETAAIHALSEYFAARFEFPARRREHLAKYWAAYEKRPEDAFFQDNIVAQLSSHEPEDRTRIHEVIGRIRRRRRLTVEETLLELEVLAGENRYDDLDRATAQAMVQYPTVSGVAFYRALCLDQRGQTAAAMAVLMSAVNRTEDANLLKLFAQMAARSGLRVQARELCERLLEKPDLSRKAQYTARHMLLALVADEGSSDTVEAAAWQLGRVADQNDEEEEGVFLAAYMMATTEYRPADEKAEEVRSRIKAYCSRFPTSQWFRMGEIPKDATGEQLIAHLSEMVGTSPEHMQRKNELFRQLRDGQIQAPLSWRPRLLIPGIDNLGQLFAITTRTRRDIRWASLVVTTSGETALPPKQAERAKPVFDLVTLLSISALGLWGAIFRLWKVVTVPKATVFELSRTAYSAYDHGGQAILDRTAQDVAAHSGQIFQPGAFDEAESARFGLEELKSIAAICAEHGTTFCSVDRAARMAVNIDAPTECSSIGLLDLIVLAESRGVIGREVALTARGTIASWNVLGADLSADDAAAFLIVQLRSATAEQTAECLNNPSDLCGRFLKSRWRPDTGFQAAATDIGDIVAAFATSPDPNARRVCEAVVMAWFSVAVLHKENKLAAEPVLALALYHVVNVVRRSSAPRALVVFAWSVIQAVLSELVKTDSTGERVTRFRLVIARTLARMVHRVTANLEPFEKMMREKELRELVFAGLTPGTKDYDDYLREYMETLVKLDQGKAEKA